MSLNNYNLFVSLRLKFENNFMQFTIYFMIGQLFTSQVCLFSCVDRLF